MKTKVQKQADIEASKALLEKTQAVLFFDFNKVRTADLKNLRQELKKAGSPMKVVKKRLLGIALKGKQLPESLSTMKTPVATVFASNYEAAAASVYKFFSALEKEKKVEGKKMLGGVDVARGVVLSAEEVLFVGQLPPREILLAQLLGMIAAPIKSFLYVLDQKSKRS